MIRCAAIPMSAQPLESIHGSPSLPPRRLPLDLRDLFTVAELREIANKHKVGFLDSAMAEVATSIEAQNWCGLIQSGGTSNRRCDECSAVFRAKPEGKVQYLEWIPCGNALQRALLPIPFNRQVIGYVVGRPLVSGKVEPLLASFRDSTVRNRAEHVLKMPISRRNIEDSMSAALAAIIPRCQERRRSRILEQTHKVILEAKLVESVYEALFRGIQNLFGPLKVVNLWQEHVDVEGECYRLIRSDGGDAREDRFRIGRRGTHLSLAITKMGPYYQPNLRKGDSNFNHVIPTPWPKSVLTIPLRLGAQGTHAALQLQSIEEDFFRSEKDREMVVELALFAAETSSKIALRRELKAANLRAEGAKLVTGILLDATWSRSDILRRKQEIYRIFAEQLFDLAGPECIAASVRLRNRLTDIIGFVAATGPGFTQNPQRMQEQYAPSKNGAAHKALSDGHLYYPDVHNRRPGDDYFALIPETVSLWIMSFEVHGERVGIVSLDFKSKAACNPAMEERFAALIDQFQRVLEVLEDRQDLMIAGLQRSLSEPGSLDKASQTLVSEVKDLFEARACALYLRRTSQEAVTLEGATNSGDWLQDYPFGEGIVGWVAENQKTVRIRDTCDTGELNRVREMHGVSRPLFRKTPRRINDGSALPQSFLAAPLVARGRILGVIALSVKNSEAKEFSVQDETFLQELAGGLARSLDARWLAEDTQNQLTELLGERNWHDRLKKADGLTQACQVLCDQLCHRTRARGAYMVFADEEEDLSLNVASGILNTLLTLPAAPVPPPKGSAIRGIWNHWEWASFCLTLKECFSESAGELIQSGQSIEIPLDRAIARLLLVWQGPRQIRDTIDREIADFEDSMQAALRLARLQKRQEAANNDLLCLQDLAIACTSENSLRKNCEAILEVALKEAGLCDGTIRLLRSPNEWETFASTSDSEQAAPPIITTTYLLRRCLQTKSPFVVDSKDKERLEYLASIEDKSRRDYLEQFTYLIAVPLHAGQECLGTITLESKKPGPASKRSIEFLETLGKYASVAIHSEQLREKELEARPFEILGTMFGGLSHVLRNKVNNAKAAASVAEIDGLPLEKRKTHIAKIKKNLDKIEGICRDLKRLSSHGHDAMIPIDVNNLFAQVWGNMPKGQRSKASPYKRLDQRQPRILANPTQIEVALVMLVQNALEAMPLGGNLIYWTRERHGYVEILIGDTGTGMDAATKARCMEPFYTTKTKGTGMGLAVVKTIARRHQCVLTLHTRQGKGTLWKLRFPRAQN